MIPTMNNIKKITSSSEKFKKTLSDISKARIEYDELNAINKDEIRAKILSIYLDQTSTNAIFSAKISSLNKILKKEKSVSDLYDKHSKVLEAVCLPSYMRGQPKDVISMETKVKGINDFHSYLLNSIQTNHDDTLSKTVTREVRLNSEYKTQTLEIDNEILDDINSHVKRLQHIRIALLSFHLMEIENGIK